MSRLKYDVVPYAKPFDPEITSSSPALPLFVLREFLKAALASPLDAPATLEMKLATVEVTSKSHGLMH